MKNRFGFFHFEIIVGILLLLIVTSILLLNILKSKSYLTFDTMRKSSVVFFKIVSTNISSFSNSNVVYLQEVIDGGFIDKIKNPVGDGYCSTSESFVSFSNSNAYVTLKCGDLLIDHVDVSSKRINIYKVTEWNFNKNGDNYEERLLYNCYENGKEIFSSYIDESYFIYKINKKYQTSVYSIDDISSCRVISKFFYRTKKKVT